MNRLLSTLIILLATCFVQCSSEKKQAKKHIAKAPKEVIQRAMKVRPVIHYRFLPVHGNEEWLKSLGPGDTRNSILLINRIDKANLLLLDTLVLPDLYTSDNMDYAPYPPSMAALREIRKMVVISYATQSFAVYLNGWLIKWGPACLGKAATPTPTGIYFSNWKSKSVHSTENYDWILNWCFNLDNKRGVSMHEFILPGYPASHACVRLTAEDAHWFYTWGDQWILADAFPVRASGTPVLIYGEYPFGQRRPWKSLPEDNKALTITESQLTTELEEFLPIITTKQYERDSVLEVIKAEKLMKDTVQDEEL